LLDRENFGADAFESSNDSTRITGLEAELATRLAEASDFDGAMAEIIAELWAFGHDLWNLDHREDLEIWGRPGGAHAAGLVVTFWRTRRVDVGWYTLGSSSPEFVRARYPHW